MRSLCRCQLTQSPLRAVMQRRTAWNSTAQHGKHSAAPRSAPLYDVVLLVWLAAAVGKQVPPGQACRQAATCHLHTAREPRGRRATAGRSLSSARSLCSACQPAPPPSACTPTHDDTRRPPAPAPTHLQRRQLGPAAHQPCGAVVTRHRVKPFHAVAAAHHKHLGGCKGRQRSSPGIQQHTRHQTRGGQSPTMQPACHVRQTPCGLRRGGVERNRRHKRSSQLPA